MIVKVVRNAPHMKIAMAIVRNVLTFSIEDSNNALTITKISELAIAITPIAAFIPAIWPIFFNAHLTALPMAINGLLIASVMIIRVRNMMIVTATPAIAIVPAYIIESIIAAD